MSAHRPVHSTDVTQVTIRAMRSSDLDAVVELDASVFGEVRRAYFERRLSSLEGSGPAARTIGLVAEMPGAPAKLVGLVMGTLTSGEFGFAQVTALVDSIAVHPSQQRKGIGRQLAAAFLEESAALGARDVYTLVNWNAWDMLKFFDSLGFALASTVPLRRQIG